MDRQLDMVVNRLPEPTWNRLNMNETKLAGVAIPAEADYQIITAENTKVRKLGADASKLGTDTSKTKSGSESTVENSSTVSIDTKDSKNLWDSIETGMGDDITKLGQGITPNLFIVSTACKDISDYETVKSDAACDETNNSDITIIKDKNQATTELAGSELTRKDVTVINIKENGANTFASFLIYANKGTHSHFAFICQSRKTNKGTIGTDTSLSESEGCSSAAFDGLERKSASDFANTEATTDYTTGSILTVQVKIIAEENASVRVSCVQALGGNATGIFDIGGICKNNANIELTRLELGAAKQYTGCCIGLDGTSSSFAADIGYKESDSQHLDMNYIARHRGRHTTSRMNITGVLRDNAFKIFRGSIDFLSGCSGAKGDEQEEVLLLGDDVVNQTVPLILCAEEDVEGNHGATIGEIDERTLFYLASRGIARKEAEQLIARARIEAVSELLPLPEMRKLVSSYL